MKRPDPWLAAALSMLAPGLGQLYAGRPRRALAWFCGALASLAGTIGWIMSENRWHPLEGACWFVALVFFEPGSWVDAWLLARRLRGGRGRRIKKATAAAAFSILFPGLGHVYLYARRWFMWPVLAPVLLAPALLLMLGEALEEPAFPGWPSWLMKWPPWLAVAAGAALSAAAILHSYRAAFRRAGHAPKLPRLPAAIWALALAAWTAGQLPWQSWLKERVKSFKIPSSSMESTLLIGDRIWAKRVAAISRGDIVVFRPPDNPETDYIKRVIGLPGDRIEMRKKAVFVNGHRLSEPYAVFMYPPGGAPVRDEFGPVTVPEGGYFMMGDNRDNSRDSRFFGPVGRDSVFGRAYKRYWPLGRSGILR